MRALARRIARDLVERRNLDAYLIVLVALLASLASLVSNFVPEKFKWSIALAALGLLVYRLTVPDSVDFTADDLLNDRTAFDDVPLPARLRGAREVWVFAPSAVHLLSESTCLLLGSTVLNRPDGVVRVVVLDPANQAAIEIASRQLDDALEFPTRRLPGCLEDTLSRLAMIASWPVSGSIEYRRIGYNPGFSLFIIDPSTSTGTVIVEFHGIRNDSPAGRMHIELTRKKSERWYAYWIAQFHQIWEVST
ncbi:MAG TPA: hypothetical protein VE465_19300 [Streptosporangiaceae bacterium]|jgi:hypothetical protein|nr:hypothetical protein [Streptosporangiaceae bacterium]